MSAHDTRCSARDVKQNSFIGPAVPPDIRLRRVGGDKPRFETESREILPDASEPLPVDVDRGEIELGELAEMRCLAARSRARVEDAHPVTRLEQWRRELRARVLHRKPPFGESGQVAYWAGPLDDHACCACRMRGDIL